VSEALQGYAPVQAPAEVADSFTFNPTAQAVREEIDKHPCHRSELLVPLANAKTAKVVLWRADDLHHFPVRIQCANLTNSLMLDLTEIRTDSPTAQLFLPQDGFTAYSDSVKLMNELIIRDASLAKKYDKGVFADEPQDVRSDNWHAGPAPAIER
jgi:hypothetical protein